MVHEGWALVCQFGLWGWIAATVGFITAAFPTRDQFAIRPAAIWGGAFLIFFLLWLAGMVLA